MNTSNDFPKTNLISQSQAFMAAMHTADRVANSMASVLIYGESGSGKEVIANYIHNKSPRVKGSFVGVNCSSIPAELLESELFGHIRGAFTGANEARVGLFEAAENGTLFLDEIGDLSLLLQAKLLRVLQERKIKRVGENRERAINCRIISATHRSLQEEVKAGRFREDLFYRLNVVSIGLPSLRERKEDIVPLAEFFLNKFSLKNNTIKKAFSEEALKYLVENKWTGNVRELENAIERAVILGEDKKILPKDIYGIIQRATTGFASGAEKNAFCVEFIEILPHLSEVIEKYILFAVDRNDGARDKTAREIGIDRKTLYKRTHNK